MIPILPVRNKQLMQLHQYPVRMAPPQEMTVPRQACDVPADSAANSGLNRVCHHLNNVRNCYGNSLLQAIATVVLVLVWIVWFYHFYQYYQQYWDYQKQYNDQAGTTDST